VAGWRPNTGQRIETICAWIATEPHGGEGVCSVQAGDTHLPMIGADGERIESLRRYAERVRRMTGYPVRLVRFTQRVEIEELP
jgi:hypothetical protein